jgi:hypothetical protein
VWPAPPWCRLSWPARSGHLVLPLQVRLPICLLSSPLSAARLFRR